MLLWISANWGTLLVAAVLAAVVVAIVRKIVMDKRAGRHLCGGGSCGSCGGGCAGCAGCGACHKA